MRLSYSFAVAAVALAAATPAFADVVAPGYLTAIQACAAPKSIRTGANPGKARLEVGKTYRVTGRNSVDASHYHVIIDSAQPTARWVGVECGAFSESDAPLTGPSTQPAPESTSEPTPRPTPEPTTAPPPRPISSSAAGNRLLLAASWQPAFCESKNNSKVECQTLTQDRYDATHFSLHGLWPQGDKPGGQACKGAPTKERACECAPSGAPGISPTVMEKLRVAMPGAASDLQTYEWNKHGTCYNQKSEDQYFSDAVALMAQLNNSEVQKLFAANIGKELKAQQIIDAFDQSFGPGAGQRVKLGCYNDNKRRLIKDISINLNGEVTPDAKLGDLMRAAQTTDIGCARGVVDPIGLQ